MTVWRVVYALGLLVFVAAPVFLPFHAIGAASTWTWSEDDATRLQTLGGNTLKLTAATVALALPLGLAVAVLLFRTTFPGRRFFIALLAVALFVPLPVI